MEIRVGRVQIGERIIKGLITAFPGHGVLYIELVKLLERRRDVSEGIEICRKGV